MNRFSMRGERGVAGPGVLIGGTVLFLILAFVVTVLLPLTGTTADDGGEARSYDELALEGRALYVRESCFSCHTQAVRDTFSDSLLGPSQSQASLYDNEAPNLIGVIRLGPDLTCVGDREDDPNWYVRHLKDPGAVRDHSTMPAYGYLSNGELQALAAYLLRLTCQEG